MDQDSARKQFYENSKKNYKVRELSISDKAAKKALAPFLRRIKKQKTQKVVSEADDHQRYVRSKVKDVISKLTSFCKDSLEVPTVVNETSEVLREITKSLGVSSYLVDESNEYLVLNAKYMPKNSRHTVKYKIEPGTTVAAYVAFSQEFLMSDDILGDTRFPLGIPGTGTTVKSVLCVPVLATPEGKCMAVVELFRDTNQDPFSALDLQICVSMTGWMGAAIYQNNERLFLLKKTELNNYLMTLVEFFFAGCINFDKFVSDLVECAKLSVYAERGSFYVMEEEVTENTENDIIADVYEEGLDSTRYTFKKKNKQRFTKNSTGFVVYVAKQGKIINIGEADSDPMFSRTSDWHGFITKSVIGVPLKGNVGVVGVLQLVNKLKGPCFTERDEILLKQISSYAYLTCQHHWVQDQLKIMSYRCDGNMELLKIQMKPCPDDLRFLRYLPIYKKSEMPKGFFNFDWLITGREDQSPAFAVFMFTNLLGEQFFDYYKLTEFILTVKKSYRDNPYHNFSHAFTVCHCVFNIIHRNKETFTQLQILALMVGTICHDSDHVGFTNNFLEMTNHWLANLYWESPLEHHHYDVCVLMVEASELFLNMSDKEIAETYKLIKFLILATDLVHYFRNRNQLNAILKSGSFDWNSSEHQLMFFGLIMTVCDVSGQCKPFYSAKKVTEGLYREFYCQGDLEKKLGFTPLSMMDREKTSTIPENQIQFLSLVCIPSVEMLTIVFPNTSELLTQCVELKECWSDILAKKVVEVWKVEDCLLDKAYFNRNKDFGIK